MEQPRSLRVRRGDLKADPCKPNSWVNHHRVSTCQSETQGSSRIFADHLIHAMSWNEFVFARSTIVVNYMDGIANDWKTPIHTRKC
jgi:hypothetical protein